MKKIILILFLVGSSLFADLIWNHDIEEGYDKAEKEHKVIFVILSQKGCPACKYMQNVVLKNKNVVKALEKDFVTVHLDIHTDDVPLALEHFVTPTLYFVDSEEKVLHRVDGYENAKDLLEELENVKALNPQ